MPKELGRENGKISVNGDLETNLPGVFAIGDNRMGGIPRIGAAVGDGQMAERNVFQYFDREKKKQQPKAIASSVKKTKDPKVRAAQRKEFEELIDQLFDNWQFG